MYIQFLDNERMLYLPLYVDDIVLVSNDENIILNTKQKLKEEFDMQDLGNLRTFLEINVRQAEKRIYLSQKNYVNNLLQCFQMHDCKETRTPMESGTLTLSKNAENTFEEKKPVRELIGCLMHLMLAIRPDLSAAVNNNHLKIYRKVLKEY